MNKPVLIVCPREFLENAYENSILEIQRYVEQIITEPYSESVMEHIIDLLEYKQISTILTRGIWFNQLLACQYIREHPNILVKQMPIDTRSQMHEVDQIRAHGYRSVAFIAVNSPLSDAVYSPGRYSFTTFDDFNLCVLSINNLKSASDQIHGLLQVSSIDAFWGDAIEFSELLDGYPIIKTTIHGFVLAAMIRDAVQYAKSLDEQDYKDFTDLLSPMLHFISEGIFVFDKSGKILVNSGNYIVSRIAPSLSKNDTIQDVFGMSVSQLLELPANSIIVARDRHYLANVFSAPGPVASRFFLVLDSRSRIGSLDLSARTQMASHKFPAKYSFNDIICADEKMKSTVDTAKTYALFDETVLITGETGTGKELFASAIHQASQRRPYPFVAINCATFSETLIDSELFGYEKGSFTGALSTGKRGLFEIAHQGTIFLDEISEIPLSLQARLLRVLQEKTIRRIGGKETIPIDVRIIAASNKNLYAQCRKGLFRYDLYYRLSVLDLNVPPLRGRKDDIIPLFEFFLKKSAQAITKKLTWNDSNIFKILLKSNWNGNVRALENTALRTVILAKSHVLTEADVLNAMSKNQVLSEELTEKNDYFRIPLTSDLDELEHQYVLHLMDIMNQDKNAVCQYLKISKPTLWRKLNYKKED